MAPPASKILHCSHCAKQFGRTEHLKRHELIHTSGRHFTCDECGKGFQRRDALNRHELTHRASTPSLLSKGVRACNACAAAKTRCSGGSPCSRCHNRNIQCVHPETTLESGSLGENPLPTQDPMNSFILNDATSDFHSQLYPSTEAMLPFGASNTAFNADFWDPNILSTSNWLDAVIGDNDFQSLEFGFDVQNNPLPTDTALSRVNVQAPSPPSTRSLGQTRKPVSGSSPAVGSSDSVHTGTSTETAAEICAARGALPHTIGEYYVDGEPARLPRMKRRKLSSSRHEERNLVLQDSVFSLHLTIPPDEDLGTRIHMPVDTYHQIRSIWQMTCVAPQALWPAFETSEFPHKDVFEHLIGLYFVHFQQTLPFLHPASFNASDTHPMLLLAMASIGARFLDYESSAFSTSLSEIVRRNLVVANENISNEFTDAMTVIKAKMLLWIASLYFGDAKAVSRGLEAQHFLPMLSSHLEEAFGSLEDTGSDSAEERWKIWIKREQASRMFYALWLLDCMCAYQFQRSPVLSLRNANLPLPCHEKQWRAATAEEWHKLASGQPSTPSLKVALQELYIDKRLPKDRGEFARIIMIHGLFQRTWDVERYYGEPLSHWEPTAKKQSSRDVLPSEPVLLLSIPTYTKWQNSVCDCIDILHWQANATIGQASGLEHPTVVFLHLSRVVLLSPIDVIVRFAKTLLDMHRPTPSETNADRRIIHRWATQGQYKSRLAAIHAGVVFWHLRRYSIDGFYEAPAVALAALMLWAFSKFAPRQTAQRQSDSRDKEATTRLDGNNEGDAQEESSDDSTCSIILLDRPADDELVQQFIRSGNKMRAHITGVGDLYGPDGQHRVLLEGCKLLRTLKCWRIQEDWLDLLEKLRRQCLHNSSE